MKKTLLLFGLLIISCKSYIANEYFKSVGVFDNDLKLEKLSNDNNEIVLFGMHHIGTEKFYNNVRKKVDSLTNLNYKIFYEMILTDNIKSNDSIRQKSIDTTMTLKFRKAFGLSGLSKKGSSNYVEFFKEKGIRIKKELIQQPKLKDLGLANNLSENVDATMDELIKAYEIKYGNIVLEDYDFNTSLFDNYDRNKCKYKINKKVFDEFVLHYRNGIVLNKINQEKDSKIAIIYGKAHFIEIKDSLHKLGYKMIN